MNFIFPDGNVLIPTDELHHFSEGWVNHQPEIDNEPVGWTPPSSVGRFSGGFLRGHQCLSDGRCVA